MKVGDGRKRRNNIRNNVKNIESKGTYMQNRENKGIQCRRK